MNTLTRTLTAAAAAGLATAGLALPAAADPGTDILCEVWDHVGGKIYVSCVPDDVTIVGYQWERDGVAIPGATGSDYDYSDSDRGHLFTATLRVSRDGQETTVRTGQDIDGYRTGRAVGVYDWACSIQPLTLDGASLDTELTVDLRLPAAAPGVDHAPTRWSLSVSTPGQVRTDRHPAFWAPRLQGDTVRLADLMSLGTLLEGARSEQSVFAVHARTTITANGVRDVVVCPDEDNFMVGIPDLGPFADADPTFPVADRTAGDTDVTGTLTASTAGWPTGATFTYQWTRDGQEIAGATGASYTLVPADSGKAVGVVVQGTVDGITAWQWGEVTAGTVTAPSDGPGTGSTAQPATGGGAAATQSTTGSAAPQPGAKASSGSLAATGSTALPVLVAAAVLVLAGGAAVIVRRVRSAA